MQYHLLLLEAFINLLIPRVMNWQNCRKGQHLISDEKLFFWIGSHKNEFCPKLLKIATQHHFLKRNHRHITLWWVTIWNMPSGRIKWEERKKKKKRFCAMCDLKKWQLLYKVGMIFLFLETHHISTGSNQMPRRVYLRKDSKALLTPLSRQNINLLKHSANFNH